MNKTVKKIPLYGTLKEEDSFIGTIFCYGKKAALNLSDWYHTNYLRTLWIHFDLLFFGRKELITEFDLNSHRTKRFTQQKLVGVLFHLYLTINPQDQIATAGTWIKMI